MKVSIIVVSVCLVFLFVWERVDVVRVGYHIERLKTQKTLLERERDQLQVKFSALAAPERIAKVASDKLGMIPPQQGQVLMVLVQKEQPVPSASYFSAEPLRVARNTTFGRLSR